MIKEPQTLIVAVRSTKKLYWQTLQKQRAESDYANLIQIRTSFFVAGVWCLVSLKPVVLCTTQITDICIVSCCKCIYFFDN